MLDIVTVDGLVTELRVLPAPRAIVSWNTREPVDTLELTVHTLNGRSSRRLPYVVFESGQRASLDGFDEVAKIDDRRRHGERCHRRHRRALAAAADARRRLDPARQTAAHGRAATSNASWTFRRSRSTWPPFPPNAAGARPHRSRCCSARGPRRRASRTSRPACSIAATTAPAIGRSPSRTPGRAVSSAAAAYLRDLVTVEAFIAAGLPVALSISWQGDDLPGAPLARSDGHILVVRGFDARGDVIVNDPAQPAVRHVYPRAAFARCWLDHGGVALLVAPPERSDDLVACANA